MLNLGEHVEDNSWWLSRKEVEEVLISRQVVLKENEKIAFRYRFVDWHYYEEDMDGEDD